MAAGCVSGRFEKVVGCRLLMVASFLQFWYLFLVLSASYHEPFIGSSYLLYFLCGRSITTSYHPRFVALCFKFMSVSPTYIGV